jgi:acyl carrier protein
MIPPAVFDDVARVLADVLGVDARQIRPDSSPDTIETWDSVQHLNLVIALEQAFGVRFAPEEIEEAVSVQAIADLLQRKERHAG